MPPVLQPGERLPLDHLDDPPADSQPSHRQTDPDCAHDFTSFRAPSGGSGQCRCGAIETKVTTVQRECPGCHQTFAMVHDSPDGQLCAKCGADANDFRHDDR